MRPLECKIQSSGWDSPQQFKVAGLADFASGHYHLERMLLDLRSHDAALASDNFRSLPWAGFLVEHPKDAPPGRPWLSLDVVGTSVGQGDVLEIQPRISKAALRYRRGGNGNVLFATERCNSYCVMCSQPPRQVEDDWRVAQLCSLTELIDKDEISLAISGGEPTLLGTGLNRVIETCAKTLPDTAIHVLSNGRRFADADYARTFIDLHPSLSWGVPLYGSHYGLHDYVVQSAGAFAETMRGLYALNAARQRIEIRVVLLRPVVEELKRLSEYLYRNLPFVEHIALMGLEPTGFARAHHKDVWMDPKDMAPVLLDSVEYLARRGLNVSLYNLPLCALPQSLWPYAKRSISDWKQRYLPACQTCSVRNKCAGVFAWVTAEWTSRAISPIKEGMEA
ncbi:His-Xaa-Ser system radical SAM maturase HxsC [Oleiagrimonas soli]|uniref:His-Xaa-Ser system radical SAM maturase HxsC n=1 Tax=Oleiagrimonas soli TaxID=1543381 RepID=A0A099CX56_9GAMM|nr:His-Xaa-Ser system radical SAM maturase HxsC [Oleiagrimonas soli]KGI77575.1 radical SAM protein [Oleiagrimonas soli]MBB6182940.1 His-Xaa-Ser system radical SAM maturase HxsC [Oleiagrimonas soli]